MSQPLTEDGLYLASQPPTALTPELRRLRNQAVKAVRDQLGSRLSGLSARDKIAVVESHLDNQFPLSADTILSKLRAGRESPSFGRLSGVTHLDLSGKESGVLPELFGSLSRLTRLDLANNGLTALPESFGRLSLLAVLSLELNRLTVLPELFGNLSSLKYLQLGRNRLTVLPESFGRLSSLADLQLGGNRLTVVPESFKNLSGLASLDLQGNGLTVLPEWLGNHPRLTHLSFDSFKETNDLAVENRNLFAEQYSLKERCRKLPRYVVKQAGAGFDPGYGIFDHFESYRDTDGNFVVLVSPYHPGDSDANTLIAMGYTETPTLYGRGTVTFVKQIPKRGGTLVARDTAQAV